jgi:hypothetical protein
MSAALACFLALCSAQALVQFRYHPTTPTAVVTHVGQRFSALADALQIREPTLAHHDAGGTSYRSPLTLVDLAGLGNRTLAQHMDNPGFVRDYLLEQVRPCFVFGTAGWFAAAASGFHKDPRFERMYVRLEFVDDPLMRADLSHIRRDLVKPWPGLEIVRGPGGEVERVRVARSVAPRAAR